jgi:hypothetical protein
MIVFGVMGSLNNKLLIKVNVIIPKENPSNLLGHISPSNALTKYCTDFK